MNGTEIISTVAFQKNQAPYEHPNAQMYPQTSTSVYIQMYYTHIHTHQIDHTSAPSCLVICLACVSFFSFSLSSSSEILLTSYLVSSPHSLFPSLPCTWVIFLKLHLDRQTLVQNFCFINHNSFYMHTCYMLKESQVIPFA